MAISKVNKPIIASATNNAVAGSYTKASPSITGTAIDCSTYYGGDLTYKLTNGSNAPTAPCVMTFQVSPDGTNWFDYYSVAGDLIGSSVYSGTITLDRGVIQVRAIAYGNVTNAVTVEAALQAVTGL